MSNGIGLGAGLRRVLLRGAIAALATFPAFALAQGAWPTKTVTIIVPFAAGGTTDIVGRLMAQKLSAMWGQNVIVENRAGAGGNIGGVAAAKAAPDGHTIFLPSGSVVTVNPHIYKSMGFDPAKDLIPVTNLASGPMLIAVNPKVQANRRRLYATMLGVCGGPDDAQRIERLLVGTDLTPDEAEARSGLDALIACYAALRGPEALDVVDRLFLERRGREVPFAETYAAVMALRFLGEESDLVPRDRVLQSLRILLAEPKLADLVITITSGGPGGATDTVTSFIYREYRDRSNVGYGTLLAMFYLVIIVVGLTLLMRGLNRWMRPYA